MPSNYRKTVVEETTKEFSRYATRSSSYVGGLIAIVQPSKKKAITEDVLNRLEVEKSEREEQQKSVGGIVSTGLR